MNGKKHSDIREDAYYDQLIKQRIGEALRNQSKEERLDMATLEAWVEADRQKRRARIKRGVSIACCLLILCFGTIGIKYALDYDGSVAVAGKNDDTVNESGNNVVIKPNEEDAEANMGVETVVVDEWEGVYDMQSQYSKLRIPQYVPEGYSFAKLTVEASEFVEKFTYLYSDGSNQIEIKQSCGDVDTSVLYEYDRMIDIEDLEIYIKEKDNRAACYSPNDDELIYVYTTCGDDEISKIVSRFK